MEGRCLFRTILRNPNDSDVFVSVSLLQAIQERKRILADGTGHFEKCQHHRPLRQSVAQDKALAIHRLQFKFGRLGARGQCRHGSSSGFCSQKIA